VRLAAAYQIPVTASALHVYHSAVVTMPRCRLWEETAGYSHIPRLISERPTSWPRILEGHTYQVRSVAFSGDDRYIASGGYFDHTVRVWDTATGIQLCLMDDHQQGVTSVTFSGSGKKLRVVSGSDDCTVRVWDAITGAQLCVMIHEQCVTSVAASHDSQLVVSGSDDGTIRVWDVTTGTPLLVVEGHDSTINSIGISSDNKLIVSGSDDQTVRVWDSATGMQRFAITDHQGCVSSVAFSGDGRFIVSAAHFKVIRVCHADTGAPIRTAACEVSGQLLAAFSRHNHLVAFICNDSTIQLWDAATGHFQPSIVTRNERIFTSISWSDDGKLLATGSQDGTIWISETAMPTDSDAQRRSQTGHTEGILSVAFSGDGTLIVSGSWDRKVKLWSAVTGLEMTTMSGHTSWITSVAVSEDGRFVASGSDDRTLRVWEAATGTEVYSFPGHEYSVTSLAFSGNSKLVVSGSFDCTARVWDLVTGTHLYTISDHEDPVTSVAFSDDSSLIISGSNDKTIRIWDAATGTHLRTITGYTHGSIAFSDDGRSIMSRRRDGMIQVWEASQIIIADSVSTTSLPQYVEAPDSPRCDQFKLDEEGWISRLSTRNTWQRLCWLPTQRRDFLGQGITMAQSGQTVCFGADSGVITILDFSPVRIP
jgi:WD40 repeat protein